jgi:ABC-2 type transport system permease protein
MNNLADMIWIEQRKAIRSRMPLWTVLGSMLMPIGIAFLIFVSRNPEISQKLGLISAKADLIKYSTTDWPAYMRFYSMLLAAGGFMLFVLVISWVFGREFADGTLKDMLAVPVQRSSILLAKFILVAIWSVGMSIVMFIASLAMGAVIQLPGWSLSIILEGIQLMAVTVCLTIVGVMPFAFFASVGRGYLLPIGVAILTLFMANLVVIIGWGEYFPWAVSVIYAQGESALAPISYGIVMITGLAGMLATYLWWKNADQSR